jgi:phosphoribosylamine--glycine ligase
MNVLVIGGGAREHAICWKILQNSDVSKLFCIPGNGGIRQIANCANVPLNDFRHLSRFVWENSIDFTIVGPEQPLVNGIVDHFRQEGFPIFGPTQAAARLEGSKIFSKRLMQKYGIPTAEFREFDDAVAALAYLNTLPEQPIVVKADGLAAGKGVVVCSDLASAKKVVEDMLTRRVFADAGARIVIEEFMEGIECSLFVVADGKDYLTLTPAQDFKRAMDDDKGKNTGGMGSYAPTPFLTEALKKQAIKEIVEPTLSALLSEGIAYTGVLYCGLMLTKTGPKVVEFNCRFGDPETQVVLPLLNSDLLEMMQAVHNQTLGKYGLRLSNDSAVCVVLASLGYPDDYETGKVITGLDALHDSDIQVFHAGTKIQNGRLLTSGGRVLSLTARRPTIAAARKDVYQAIEKVHFDGMHFRRDIAKTVAKM